MLEFLLGSWRGAVTVVVVFVLVAATFILIGVWNSRRKREPVLCICEVPRSGRMGVMFLDDFRKLQRTYWKARCDTSWQRDGTDAMAEIICNLNPHIPEDGYRIYSFNRQWARAVRGILSLHCKFEKSVFDVPSASHNDQDMLDLVMRVRRVKKTEASRLIGQYFDDYPLSDGDRREGR